MARSGSGLSSETFDLGGGLDLKTPLPKKKPGVLTQAQNVEQKVNGGYARILGYTKFDDAEVPGEGNILGVWRYDNKVYAFRKNTGVATASMYESTGSGWTSKKSGLIVGDTYEFINYNFAGTWKMYGVNGAHKAFEWDGTTWTDITTGMTTDTPNHIIAHKKHLFLSFGPSVQHSSLGDPLTFSPILGAAEILVETGVTGFMQMSGSVLGIFGRNSTNLLSGTSSSDWTNDAFSEHGNRIGAVAGTIQQLGSRTSYLDDRGLTNLYTSDKYGDFADSTVSYLVNDILLTKKDLVTTSCVVKDKSQYRIFFSDGTGFYFTFNGNKMIGATPVKFPISVLSVVAAEDDLGDEVIYFGSSTGYVYQMENGKGFDGVPMIAYMQLAYNYIRSNRNRKRFRRAIFDVAGSGTVTLKVKPDFQFESSGTTPPLDFDTINLTAQGSLLGEANLGVFVLGQAQVVSGWSDIPGHGVAVSLFIRSEELENHWEMDSVTYDFTHGRQRR